LHLIISLKGTAALESGSDNKKPNLIQFQMNYSELIDRLGQHPQDVYQDFRRVKATKTSLFLYEQHYMHFDYWEDQVWIFPDIKEFQKFLPVLIFSYETVHLQDEDFEENCEERDYQDAWDLYEKSSKENWKDAADGKRFLAELAKTGIAKDAEINGIEFGNVTELLNVSEDEFEKCKEYMSMEKELEEAGLSEGRYRIFNKYWEKFSEHPAENEKQFLEMLSDWE
jgi:hypothetical protein